MSRKIIWISALLTLTVFLSIFLLNFYIFKPYQNKNNSSQNFSNTKAELIESTEKLQTTQENIKLNLEITNFPQKYLDSENTLVIVPLESINEEKFEKTIQSQLYPEISKVPYSSQNFFIKNDKGVFFVGSNIEYITGFKYLDQDYWFFVEKDGFNPNKIFISKPFFREILQVKIQDKNYYKIDPVTFFQDETNKNILYLDCLKYKDNLTYNDDILEAESLRYKLNLNKFLQNPESQDFYEVLN